MDDNHYRIHIVEHGVILRDNGILHRFSIPGNDGETAGERDISCIYIGPQEIVRCSRKNEQQMIEEWNQGLYREDSDYI